MKESLEKEVFELGDKVYYAFGCDGCGDISFPTILEGVVAALDTDGNPHVGVEDLNGKRFYTSSLQDTQAGRTSKEHSRVVEFVRDYLRLSIVQMERKIAQYQANFNYKKRLQKELEEKGEI